jgi:hypothetical protein
VKTRGRLFGAVSELSLGGVVFTIEVEEDLDEKVEVRITFQFLPNVPATAIGVGVGQVDL